MQLLRTFPLGSSLPSSADSADDSSPCELWFDLPTATGRVRTVCCLAESAELDLYDGKLGGTAVRVLADTGASHCFASATLAVKLNLTFKATVFEPVRLADKSAVRILAETTARLRMGSLVTWVSLLVLPSLTGSADLILG